MKLPLSPAATSSRFSVRMSRKLRRGLAFSCSDLVRAACTSVSLARRARKALVALRRPSPFFPFFLPFPSSFTCPSAMGVVAADADTC